MATRRKWYCYESKTGELKCFYTPEECHEGFLKDGKAIALDPWMSDPKPTVKVKPKVEIPRIHRTRRA